MTPHPLAPATPSVSRAGRVGLVALIRAEMAARAAAGHRPRVEDYLPTLDAHRLGDDAVLDLVAAEALARRDAGDHPPADEYVDRFPHLADRVRDCLAVLDDPAAVRTAAIPAGWRPSPTQTPLPGAHAVRVPGYEVLGVLGRGGMGVVYKARQVGLNRTVALKMVLAGGHASPDDRRRFRREAEAVAALRHPNIVQIYDVGEHAGTPYFSLEYVPGGTLAGLIGGRPQPPRLAADLALQLARGVQAAHDQTIVHRDLKPANVLLQIDDLRLVMGDCKTPPPAAAGRQSSITDRQLQILPKITDFGLAKRLDGGADLTATGEVAGTPQYMAPEQVSGVRGAVGPAADIHALGVILYEMLTGRPPFQADSPVEAMTRVAKDPAPPVRHLRPDCPRDLETVALKCLEKDPANRYPSSAALADDLARFLAGEPVAARPVGPAERGWRWCRRNPAAAGAAAAVFATLAVAAAVSGAFAVRSARDADRLRDQTAEAERRADEARASEVLAVQAGLVADAARDDAVAARAEERRQKQAAIDQKAVRDRELNATRMGLAQRAWAEGNAFRAAQQLDLARNDAPALRRFEWYYLQTAVTRAPEMTGPGGPGGVAGTPDGRVTAWAGTGCIAVGTAFGPYRYTVPFQPAFVQHLAVSADGRYLLAAGNSEKAAVLFDAATGKVLRALAAPAGRVTAVALAPDGSGAAVGYGDGKAGGAGGVAVFDPATGAERTHVRAAGGAVRSVAFSADGRRLYAAPDLDWAAAWDAATGDRVPLSDGPKTAVAVACSPDGRLVAVAAAGDGTVHVLDAATGAARWAVRSGARTPGPLAFSADGKLLAAGADDGIVRVWDAGSGERVNALRGHRGAVAGVGAGAVAGLAFLGPGVWLGSSGMDGRKLVRDAAAPQDYWPVKLDGPGRRVTHLFPVPRTADVACLDGDGFAAFHLDRMAGKWLPTDLKAAGGRPCLLAGTAEVLVVFPDGTARAAAVRDGRTRPVPLFDGGTPGVTAAAATPDGAAFATGHKSGSVRVYRTADLPRLAEPTVVRVDGVVADVAVRPDAREVAVGLANDQVRIYRVDPPGEVGPVPGGETKKPVFAYSPDGRFLAVGGYADGAVRVWTADGLRPVAALWGLAERVVDLDFSPDGERLATAAADRSVTVWDVGCGLETVTFYPGSEQVDRVRFTPDGLCLMAATDQGVRCWDGRPARGAELTVAGRSAFRAADVAVTPPAADRDLNIRVGRVNTTGRPFDAPPPGMILRLPCRVLVTRAADGAGKEEPVSDFVLPVPVWAAVPPGGRVENAVSFTSGGLRPGRYRVRVEIEGPVGQREPAVPPAEFDVK